MLLIEPRREPVFASLSKIPAYFLKILCLGCLLALLAAPAWAEEQTPKEKTPPPATPQPQPAAKPHMAPRRRPMPQAEKSMPRTTGAEEMKMKGVDDTVGGQEIRNKKGPEDK
jgi:hypothetical protein